MPHTESTFYYAKRYTIDTTQEYDLSGVDIFNDDEFNTFVAASGTIGISTDVVTGISTSGISTGQYLQTITDVIQPGTTVIGIQSGSIVISQESINVDSITTTIGFGSYPAYSIPEAIQNLQQDNILIYDNLYLQGPIYDKNDYSGIYGQILLTDGTAVYWSDISGIGTPLQTIGIWDEGVFQGVVANLNFVDHNDPNNIVKAEISGISSKFADIKISDRWALVSNLDPSGPVYRSSRVGINNNNPLYYLDVSGDLRVTQNVVFTGNEQSISPSTGTLVVTGGVGIGFNLNVGEDLSVFGSADVYGDAYVQLQLEVDSYVDVGDYLIVRSTADSIGISTGALVVKGGAGIEKSLNVGSSVTVFGTTDSLGIGSGALVVEGGAGIKKSLSVGSSVSIGSSTDSSGISTGALVVEGGVGIKKSLSIGSSVSIGSSTDSTNKDTGALIVDGGVGIEKSLSVGSSVSIGSSTDSSGIGTGALVVEGGVGIKKSLSIGSSVSIGSSIDSTNKDTGALIVEGGVGIEKSLSVGSSITVFSTTDSTDKDTGALVVEGGVGIEKTLNVGNNFYLSGSGEITGTLDVLSANSSSDKDSGAVVVTGGLGVGENINAGGYITAGSVQESTSKDTGSLVVEGGVGIEKSLNVGKDASITSTLKVGAAGTVITTTGIGSVGFGTNLPKRDIDFANKDVFFNQGAIYDSNENVGFRTEEYQVPRNVLTTVGVDTAGNIIPGRFFDAQNLIGLNLDFIASEAVGYITSRDYKNPEFVVVNSLGIATDPVNCKDDIKDILKSITFDITKGGNSKSVGAGLSYYNGNTLLHITGNDPNGYSVKEATIAAIQKAVDVTRYVINNSYYPTSYQMRTFVNDDQRFADAASLIIKNKEFIAREAVDRMLYYYNVTLGTPFSIPTGSQSCIDDIKLILDAITYNLQFGGNSRVYDAASYYITNPSLLQGEQVESAYAYQSIVGIATYIIRNETVTKISGTLNTYSQVKDLTIQNDTSSPKCADQASAIASFVGIVTTAILNSTLPNRSEPVVLIPIPQIRDLTLPIDPLRGSNTDPDGCSNVVSAITVCAGIVTTIIGNGPSASPKVTYPDGKIVWSPSGADSKNLIYVTKYGNDSNDGKTEGSAKLTIGAAAAIAEPGDTIMVRSGFYVEKNPIGLRTDVTVSGQDLRLVTICPQYDDDVFYVRRGCLIENLNFSFSKDPLYSQINVLPISFTKGAAVAFPPPIGIGGARSGCLDPGPATEGLSGRWRSPYIRNCTNFMSGSIGMKIDGDHATVSDPDNVGNDLKCMVCDSFTQYNENGIGVSITNNGYAQLVSIFTINCDIAIYCDTGGSCDLTNSNSSFGNFGLVAVGLGRTEFTGKVYDAVQNFSDPPTRAQNGVDAGSDKVTFVDVKDSLGRFRKPFDGQALFFQIDLSKYPDTVVPNKSVPNILTEPMKNVQSIKIINGGSGFSAAAPPTVLIRDKDDLSQTPKGPQGIIAEVSPNVDPVTGAITSIDVVNSGRNYLPSQNLEVFIPDSGNTGVAATVVMAPIYYTVDSATDPVSVGITSITTVTFNEFIPYELFGNEDVSFKRISRILTSSHSFEYVGCGTNINTATPFAGAVPIKENEIVALDGAQIPFTSTDQKGNFDIGEGFQINQPTATIRGRDFSKAIQAEVTPLILALR